MNDALAFLLNKLDQKDPPPSLAIHSSNLKTKCQFKNRNRINQRHPDISVWDEHFRPNEIYALDPQSVGIIFGKPPASSIEKENSLLFLGKEGAIDCRNFSCGFDLNQGAALTPDKTLLISENPILSIHLLDALDARNLRPHWSFSGRTPEEHSFPFWVNLLKAASQLEIGHIILAIDQPLYIEAFLDVLKYVDAKKIYLYVNQHADYMKSATMPHRFLPRLSELSQTLGIATFATIERLTRGIELSLKTSLFPDSRKALPIVRNREEVPLLRRLLDLCQLQTPSSLKPYQEAGLEIADDIVLSTNRQHLLSRALKRVKPLNVDAFICLGDVPNAVGFNQPQFFLTRKDKISAAYQLDELSLYALSNRINPQAFSTSEKTHIEDPRPLSIFAERHLIERFTDANIHPIAHRFVRSASAASRAARELRAPYQLRAFIPSLRPFSEDDKPYRRDSIQTITAIRQHYHDILFAAENTGLHDKIEGFMVAEDSRHFIILNATLLCFEHSNLLELSAQNEKRQWFFINDHNASHRVAEFLTSVLDKHPNHLCFSSLSDRLFLSLEHLLKHAEDLNFFQFRLAIEDKESNNDQLKLISSRAGRLSRR